MDVAAEKAGKGSKSPAKFQNAARKRVLEKALQASGQPKKFKDPALNLYKPPANSRPGAPGTANGPASTKPPGGNKEIIYTEDGAKDIEIVLGGD